MSTGYIDAPVRCTIEFDEVDKQGLPLRYVITYGLEPEINVDESGAYIPNEEDNSASNIIIDEGESDDAGNPIGIMSYNTAHIEIVDTWNRLHPTNQFSEYHNKMRYGVKLYFEISYDNGYTWEPYGEYYVTDWSAGIGSDVVYINGCDIIQYKANMDIPKLPAYSGISIQELLVNLMVEVDKITSKNNSTTILKGNNIPSDDLGNEGDYYINLEEVGVYRKIDTTWKLTFYIDKRLNLDMKYGITVGSKLRETLNSFAQALNAKVIIDRHGAIRFVPSNETYGKVYTMGVEHVEGTGETMYNSANIYNGIKYQFNKPGDGDNGTLLNISGQRLKPGVNNIYGVKFNSKALALPEVVIDHDTIIDGQEIDLDTSWVAYQDGIDITIINNSNVEVPYDLYMDGVYIDTIKSSVSTDIKNTDTKVRNNLELYSDIIKTEEEAIKAAEASALTLERGSKRLRLTTTLSEKITSGDIIQGNTGDPVYDKVFKVIHSSTNHGVAYSKTLLVEETGGVVSWSDIDTWEDTDENEIWFEGAEYVLPEEPEVPEVLYWTDIGIWLDSEDNGIWKESNSQQTEILNWIDTGKWLDTDENGLWKEYQTIGGI